MYTVYKETVYNLRKQKSLTIKKTINLDICNYLHTKILTVENNWKNGTMKISDIIY